MIKHKLIFLCLALLAATTLFASDTQVDGIWYDFDNTNLTASVTYRGSYSYKYYEYSGSVVIPASVSYNQQTYSVTTIGDEAFRWCNSLTSVTIPNSVTTIGDYAFRDCSGLTKTNYTGTIASWCKIKFSGKTSNPICYSENFFINDVEVKDLVIPEGVDEIGEWAFVYCRGLTSVTIPNSVTTIGERAFEYCSGLKKTNYTGTIASWCKIKFSGNTSNPIWYSENFFINDVEVKDLVIPEGVDEIGERAFVYCRGLTSVTIPNSVTTIGDRAFYGCTGLTSITIPNSVTTIGEWAFCDCSGLKKTNYMGTIASWCKIKFGDYYANPMYYGHNFFINDVEIKDLVIPEGVDTIGNYAFYYCSGLTSVTIPNSVTKIGSSAFEDCSGLTSVTIGNSVTTIGDGAFCGCEGLTGTLIIPNSVTTIGNSAFRGCSSLTSVTIPNSVKTIGKEAFYHCRGLTSVTCYATTPPTCGSDCFYNVDKTIPVYVPTRSEDAYKQAEEWKAFTNILPIGAEIVPSTDEIITQPSTNSVIITWPSNDNAVEYKLVITKDGVVFCTLTFNAQGQLIGIAFAPNRDGSRMLDAAVMTSNGWQFTVTGLDQACKYGYTIDALNASKQSIKHYEGEFATDGYTSLEWVTSDQIQGINKMLLDGHLYILRDGNLFTATGARVK